MAWLVAALVGVVVVLLAFTLLPGVGRDRSAWGPPVVALAVVPVLLAPWWLPALLHGAGEGLLLDGGLLPVPTPDGLDLGLGRFHDLGAPWWLGVVLPVLAALALVPRRTRIPVLICWVVALLAVLVAVGLGSITLDLAALSTLARPRLPPGRRAGGAGHARSSSARSASPPPRGALAGRAPCCSSPSPSRRRWAGWPGSCSTAGTT